MTKQKRFTKDFEDEAVPLVGTSGRTKRQIADDLGVGLSTLTRWISKSRDHKVGERARGAVGAVGGSNVGVFYAATISRVSVLSSGQHAVKL
jgi:transposase-like protein